MSDHGDEVAELREQWARIAEGIQNEEEEEAKLDGIDGHEEESGGSDSQPEEGVDEVLDGHTGGEASSDSTDQQAEVYVESPEGDGGGEDGGVPAEVEGYDPGIAKGQCCTEAAEQMEIVHGHDDRVRVYGTASYPWRTICDLEITAADGGKWGCSGALIGPRTVLTNGHCVYMHDHGGWARKIRVIPGKNGGSEPFGSATATFYHSVKGWTKSRSSNYDYAAVILPSNKKLGNMTGWMGLANLSFWSLLGLRVNNSGYPGDKPNGTQWWNANNILAVTSRRVYYRIDTSNGQSGSPVWRFKSNKRHIVAVHNTGGSLNGGVRLASPVFKNLVNWKNKYK